MTRLKHISLQLEQLVAESRRYTFAGVLRGRTAPDAEGCDGDETALPHNQVEPITKSVDGKQKQNTQDGLNDVLCSPQGLEEVRQYRGETSCQRENFLGYTGRIRMEHGVVGRLAAEALQGKGEQGGVVS